MLAPLGANFGNIVTTVYASILRETKTKGSQARFQKTSRGHFVYQSPQAS
jgi:hypothetical protein